VILLTERVRQLIVGLAEAGWKRRRQTRHLGGKIVSSNEGQMDLNRAATALLTLVF
jgi:hypothetical protein